MISTLNGIQIQDLKKTQQTISGDITVGIQSDGCSYYRSAAVDIQGFLKDCAAGIKDRLNLGTAAFEESGYFSLKDHDHNDLYNVISISQIYDKSDKIEIGKARAQNAIYLPVYSIPAPQPDDVTFYPTIGTVKFITYIYPKNDTSLSGWCLADGRSLNKNTYEDAFKVFGYSYSSSSGGNTFNIPNLNKFIRPINSGYTNQKTRSAYQHEVYLSAHSHGVNAFSGFDAYLNFQLRASSIPSDAAHFNDGGSVLAGSDTSGDPQTFLCQCTGNENETAGHQSFTFKLDKISFNGSIGSAGGANEAYPRHLNIPVYIYIGFPKNG